MISGDEHTETDQNIKSKSNSNKDNNVDPNTGLLAGVFFYLIVGLFVVWFSKPVRDLIFSNPWPFGIAAAIIVAFLVISFYKRSGLTSSTKHKIGIIIFVVIPALLGLVSAISLIRDDFQIPILRLIFLLIVCLLPATMYYLFIASRKSSLLQEFFSNLSRLGLFKRQSITNEEGSTVKQETEMERSIRVMSYIQKFEAVYGPIPGELAEEIITATNPDEQNPQVPKFHRHAAGGTLGGIFTPETTIPVVIATLLIGFGWFITLPPWTAGDVPEDTTIIEKLGHVLCPTKLTVHFAFLGAYFFALQMMFRRYVLKDLRANAFMATTMRIILAVIGTWAILQGVTLMDIMDKEINENSSQMLVIGFVIGAFPPVAWEMIQIAFRKATGAKYLVPSLSSEMPVSELDGLTVWHEARLQEEDVENVPNMATADIVDLMLHTRFPPDRIIDWVDQAILYTQLGIDKRKADEQGLTIQKTRRLQLGAHGIRTASALLEAYDKSKKHNDLDTFENLITSDGRSYIRTIVDTLSTIPNLGLIQEWKYLEVKTASDS